MAKKQGRRSGRKPVVQQRVANGNTQRAPGHAQTQSSPHVPDLQWPSMMPTNKPYPDMLRVSDQKPPLQELGATGTAIFSGVITSEEYNPDFHWKDGIVIYDQMRRNDAQVNAVLMIGELFVRLAKWSIEPASEDPEDVEIASFVESCLFHDMCYETQTGIKRYQTWDWTLQHILMLLQYGFSVFEICYKIEDGWVKWARWIPLLPRTIWRWWVGDDNELVGVQQWTFKDYSYQFINIPAEKLLHFAHRQEGNNWEGISLLRSAYKHWFYKQNFEKIEAIGVERNAVIPPVVKLPEGWTGADAQAAQQIGQNMRANEQMSVTLPFGWDLEFPKNQQKYAANAQEAIQYHDVMIARNFLAQFLNLGSSETGAYNLNASQLNTFFLALQSICTYIEQTVTNGAIRQLVDYNYDGVAKYPQLKASKIAAQDISTISTSLQQLANGTNPILHANPDLEDFVCDLLGIPKPPRNAVEATNPTDPNDPARPENQRAGDHQDAQPTVAQGKSAKNSQDDSGDEASDGGAAMSELLGEVRLMAESFRALDAVERGMQFMNPNHYPAGSRQGGEFAPRGMGSGEGGEGEKGAGGGRSKTARGKGAGKSEGKASGGKRIEELHATAQEEEPIKRLSKEEVDRIYGQEGKPVPGRDHSTFTDAEREYLRGHEESNENALHAAPDVRTLRILHGEDHLFAALAQFKHAELLRNVADLQARGYDVQPGRTKEETIQNLMRIEPQIHETMHQAQHTQVPAEWIRAASKGDRIARGDDATSRGRGEAKKGEGEKTDTISRAEHEQALAKMQAKHDAEMAKMQQQIDALKAGKTAAKAPTDPTIRQERELRQGAEMMRNRAGVEESNGYPSGKKVGPEFVAKLRQQADEMERQANELKAARAQAQPKAARGSKAQEARRDIADLVRPGYTGLRFDSFKGISPHQLRDMVGESNFHEALSRQSHASLRAMAKSYGIKTHTSKDAQIAEIEWYVAEGGGEQP